MESKIKNDLLYVCALIEFIGRNTKNHRGTVVSAMGVGKIKHLLEYADLNHCLDMQQVADEVIEETGIRNGSFDTVDSCRYRVPSVTAIGKVYQRLVADVKGSEEWPQTIYNVFDSYISDEISNFNGSVYYSSPEYLSCSYQAGELLA